MSVKYTEAQKQLLKDTVSGDTAVAEAAFEQVSTALELPLREGVQAGDIHSDIFEKVDVENGRSTLEYPLHYMQPGTEGDYVGFTVPTYGSIPQKLIQGDYVNIPVVDIAGAIDWDNKYARDARWDVLTDATQNLQSQLTKKKNDMGWHTLISAGYDRGATVADSDAAQGQFTTRLISLMKSIMRRNGGGNSSSINRSVLTDLYVSVEAIEDMRSWNVDQVDEVTRREIFASPDGRINRVYSVNIHDLDELGEGQEYQNFYTSTLGATMPTTGAHTDTEIVVGLNLNSNRSFIMPVAEEFTIVREDRVRQRQTSLIGLESVGFAVLDSRDVLIGTL